MAVHACCRYRGKEIEIHELQFDCFDVIVDGKRTQHQLTAKEIVSWCINAMQNTPEGK